MLSPQASLCYPPRMKTTQTLSAIPYGSDGRLISVDCDANQGLPSFTIIGMADKSISESRERIRSAITNSQFTFPKRKIVVNLAPAQFRKASTALDLPIALGILALSKQLLQSNLNNSSFVGELALNGEIRPVTGIVSIIQCAIRNHVKAIYIPRPNAQVAALLADKIKIYPVANLRQL